MQQRQVDCHFELGHLTPQVEHVMDILRRFPFAPFFGLVQLWFGLVWN